MYLARLLKPLGMRVTRIASGLPVGGDLEYADEVTLGRALEGRRDVDALATLSVSRSWWNVGLKPMFQTQSAPSDGQRRPDRDPDAREATGRISTTHRARRRRARRPG